MMPQIKIGGSGFSPMSRYLGVLAAQVGDMSEIWREVAHPFFLEHMKEQFDTEGSHGGRPWEGYEGEPAYAAWKWGIVGHNKILRWELGGPYERLYPSLTDASSPWHHVRITANSFEVGSLVPYSARLQFGGVGPKGEAYPGRAILAMTENQKQSLVVLVQRRISTTTDRFNL